MEFRWKDEEYGYHECKLYDGDKMIERIYFTDFNSPFHRENDRKNHYRRDYAYEIGYCSGCAMKEWFDEKDHNYDGFGYEGTPLHTVDEVKRWCENYLAQIYLHSYQNALKSLDEKRRRAEWFESQGFKIEETRKE